MSDRRQAVFSVARVISAAFIALLLTGPPPAGWIGLYAGKDGAAMWSISLALLVMAVRGVAAGLIAGRRLAMAAAVLSSFWAEHDRAVDLIQELLTGGDRTYGLAMTISFMILLVVFTAAQAALFGWIGGLVSRRARIDTLGARSHAWTAVGILAVLQFGYAYACGLGTARRMLWDEAMKSAVKDCKPQVEVYVNGIFPTMHFWPYRIGNGWSEVYYTDPTGRVLLGRSFVPAFD